MYVCSGKICLGRLIKSCKVSTVGWGDHVRRDPRPVCAVWCCSLGPPAGNAGFGLTPTPDGSDLIIGSGRVYLDGILVELPEGTAIGVVSVDGATLVVRDLAADGQPFAAGQ